MRITRSGLRRIIGEESARILAESKKNPHERVPGGHQMRMAAGFEDEPEEEDWDDEGGDDDYYGDPDPFGDDAALSQDLVDDGAGGWREKTDEEWYAEQLQGVMDMYGHPDPYGDDEAAMGDLEYDGAGGWKKPSLDEGEGHQVSPRKKLGRFLAKHGVDDEAVFKVINAVVARAEETGAEVTSEDITFNLDDEIIDALPDDEADAWHSMLEDILADEIDPDAFADAEAHRKDIEDTERSLDREEGLGGDGGEDDYEDDDYEDDYINPRADWFLEEGDDYDYEDEPEAAEMGDPEDPYGDMPKGEHPRGGLVHTAGFKGDSPAKSLLRRREEFPEHPSGLTGMGGPYSEYDHLHYGAGINESRWAKIAGVLSEGVDDDLGGAASATDSGDRESRRGEHLGDDPDMGPPGHDDWHIDTYEDEDIEGSDFDEMIDPADDNDDPMKPAWMQNLPYSNEPEDWEFADDPYVGGRAASLAIRQKYSETGDSDPEDDRSLPRGHRYGVSGGWGGLDEARWKKLAGILKD
jgi:hypothetical protein